MSVVGFEPLILGLWEGCYVTVLRGTTRFFNFKLGCFVVAVWHECTLASTVENLAEALTY